MKKILLGLAAASSMFFAACDDSTGTTIDSPIVGNWKNEYLTQEFKSNGSFLAKIDFMGMKSEVSGSYSVDGENLTATPKNCKSLNPESGDMEKVDCDKMGEYGKKMTAPFKIEGDKLSIMDDEPPVELTRI